MSWFMRNPVYTPKVGDLVRAIIADPMVVAAAGMSHVVDPVVQGLVVKVDGKRREMEVETPPAETDDSATFTCLFAGAFPVPTSELRETDLILWIGLRRQQLREPRKPFLVIAKLGERAYEGRLRWGLGEGSEPIPGTTVYTGASVEEIIAQTGGIVPDATIVVRPDPYLNQ